MVVTGDGLIALQEWVQNGIGECSLRNKLGERFNGKNGGAVAKNAFWL